MIKVTNLHKSYGDTEVLSGIDLHVKAQEIYALVGHSGAGKSTLLRCLNRLEEYNKGEVEIFGKNIKNLSQLELRELRREMGMIFQHFSLMSQKSVYENVAMPLRVWKYPASQIDKKVKELLDLVGLKDKAKAYPNELSGGQKQRVAVARALTLEPKILLSDEATSALDPNTTVSILELLKMINRELGLTIVLVTHEMEVVKSIAHKAMLLDSGKIIANDRIEEIFLRPDEKMKSFLAHEEILPESGVNIRLYFPKKVAFNSVITHMARKFDIDLNIVWGNIEKLNDSIVGHLVINIEPKDEKNIVEFLKQSGVLWEVAR